MNLHWVRNHYGLTADAEPFSKAVTLLEHTSRHGGSVEKPVYKIIIFEHARLSPEERQKDFLKQYYELSEAKSLATSEVLFLLTKALSALK